MPEKEFVTWEDIDNFVKKIKNDYSLTKLTGVFGIPRGGLIMAVLISHALNIPLLTSPCDDCIIIDDICDSGESLLHYYKNTSGGGRKRYHIITMYYKENALEVKPDYYLKNKEDKWIVFPWESKEE